MALSIVVPVFNAEETLRPLASALEVFAQSMPIEAILVNDGSRDRSWEIILQLATDYPWIRGINLMRNFGQHNALLCGIRAARREIIVTMDDDLQNPPEEIPAMLAKLAEGYDVVYGTPLQESHGLFRDLASQITKLALQGAMGASTAASVSAFRVFHAGLREAFDHYSGPYVSIDVLLTWSTDRFASVRVVNRPRIAGVSNYTLIKLITHALNMITGFSTIPLRFASFLGFAFTAFGVLILIYILGRFLVQGASVPGFAFLGSIIAIFSGAQLFTLGIFGEYLARMHSRTMEKPSYAVRAATYS
jgi:glycosyltransferase involved in cell wall biosynthesis